MKPISNYLSLVLLALLSIAVTGLVGSPLQAKSSQQRDVQNHGRLTDLRKQIKARERHRYNGYDNGHPASDNHNKVQLAPAFEWPDQQYGSVPDYKPQPAFKPYDDQKQKPYSPSQTSSYDPSSIIYPLVYYTESLVNAANPPQSHSSPAYPEYPFVPLTHADDPYNLGSTTQYPPLYYKDFKKSPGNYHGTGNNNFEKIPRPNSDPSTGFVSNDYFEFPKFDDFFKT